ncbi:5-hydroxytryptamine receptor 1-like [Daphnia pulex]|uniref:5-hydroxytryptamine receptor 1-like n=1 Tax=Daphnia pulex TaxID=6669 RepID=UPI001EDD6BB2|nr:5-hydroxytryptamine receptor 1-like [Daphnia pulex]
MEVDVIGWNNLRQSSTWLTMATGSLDYSGDPSNLNNQTLTGSPADPPEDDGSNTIAIGGSGGGGMIENYSLTETILISAALLFIIVGTVVGNILVCVAVCLVRRLRRPCNYLLVSLAVSDLCVALLVMPMALVYEVLGTWPFGASACDTWVAFDVLSCTASILNLCMISVDRYWAITRPLDYGVKRTPARMISCVALVWISSACISLPPLLVLGNEHGPSAAPHPSPTTTTSSILSSNNNNSQTSPITLSSNGPLANFIELATAAAGQDYQCQVCQEFGYQIYATLGSFYIPLAVMAAVYYQIFQAAKRIVDEEKKAQSHLLMTRTNSCAKQKAAAAVGGAGQPLQPVQSSLLVHPLHQPSLCTSAAMVVVRRHSDRRNSSMDSTDHSWVGNHCNGVGRPTTWPPNHDVCISSSSASSCASLMGAMRNESKLQSQAKEKEKIQEKVQTSGAAHPLSRLDQVNNMSLLDIPRSVSNNCPRRRYSSSAASTAEIHVYDDDDPEGSNRRSRNPSVGNAQLSGAPDLSSTQSTGAAAALHVPSAVPAAPHRNRQSIRTPPHQENQLQRRGSRNRLRFALNKERKASTTLGIIMSAFTLCWFPFFVLALVRPFMSHQTASLVIPRWLSSLFLWLGYANSFLNPVIYATTNKDFRLPFREILCLRCKSLNSVMREDFYQSQYGNEANKTALALAGGATQLSATAFL